MGVCLIKSQGPLCGSAVEESLASGFWLRCSNVSNGPPIAPYVMMSYAREEFSKLSAPLTLCQSFKSLRYVKRADVIVSVDAQ